MRIRKQKSALLLACAALSVLGLRAGAYISNGAIVPADSTEKPVISISDSIESNNVVDEVIWVVGDEPILKSDVEVMKLQAEAEGVKWKSDPLCSILEQLAVQKLFLHQAALDSIKVSESEISQQIDQRINYWIALPQIGSKEKLEEYQHKTLSQIRQDLHDDIKNMQLVQK
ncbi:MAG: peptidylprolyl isomerase, partial [Prevotella micans]|nr:peptidylprolyl isomerase [Prevotella micans]